MARKRKKRFDGGRRSELLVARAGGPGGSYTIPGKGTVKRAPSGVAKSYEGRGAAPAGTKKTPEVSVQTPGVVVEETTSSPSKTSTSRRSASRAVARQERLVERYVTKAYSRQRQDSPSPTLDLSTKVEETKSKLSEERDRLLNHPAVQEANAEGKVVSPKGLHKLDSHQDRGLRDSNPFAVQPPNFKSAQEDKRERKKVDAALQLLKPKGAGTSLGLPTLTLSEKKPGQHGGQAVDPIALAVERDVIQPGQAAGVIPKEKTFGQKAYQRVAEYGQLAIPFVPEAAAGVKALGLALRGAEVGGEKIAPGALSRILKPVAADTPAARAAVAASKRSAVTKLQAPQTLGQKAGAVVRSVGERQGRRALAREVTGTATRRQTAKAAGFPLLAVKGGTLPGEALLQIPVGQARALKKDPAQVLRQTAALAPGLIAGAFQLPVALGQTAGRAGLSGAGLSDYSSEEITAPAKGALAAQVDFAKHLKGVYGSGDAKRIEQATLKEGLLPEVLLAPLLGRAAKGPVGRAKKGLTEASARRRAPLRDEEGVVLTHDHGGPVKKGRQRSTKETHLTRTGERNTQRREEARHAAHAENLTQLEFHKRREEIDKAARTAAGDRYPVREGLGPKGKDTLHERQTDYIGFLARASIDLNKPEAALREIKHYTERWKNLPPARDYGVDAEALIARDAVRHFTEHPENLKSKALAKAVDEYREMANGNRGLRSMSNSERNRYLGPAVMHDIPLAEHRVPIRARDHTDATTREGAWVDLRARDKEITSIRRRAERKKTEARALGKQSAKGARLRREYKAEYARARSIKEGRDALYDGLKDFTRPGAKPNRNAKRIPYDEALEAEQVAETRKFLEDNGLNPEPAYVPDQVGINYARADQATTGGKKALPAGERINTGYAWEHGLSRQGYEHLMNEGILRQVAKHHWFDNWRRFRDQRALSFEGETIHTGKGWAKAYDQGLINRKDVALVPVQVTKRLDKAISGDDPKAFEAAAAEASASGIRPNEALPGTKYEAYPKAAFEEIVAQAQGSPGSPIIRGVNAYTNRAMLSTPSYLAAQVVAEGSQALAEVGPLRMAQGLRAAKGLNIEQDLKLAGVAGETAKAIFTPENLQTALGSTKSKPFGDSLGFFRRNVFGRSAKSFATLKWVQEVNRKTGGATRRAALTGQVMRDLNGMGTRGRKLLGLQTEIQKRLDVATKGLRGKKKNEAALKWLTENPKWLDHYEKKLHEAMGGWGNLTRTGHFPEVYRGAALVFYSFLRMSLQWPVKYAGNHPVKATALAYLAAQNNWALRRALQGDPSFGKYAQIPTYELSPDGEIVYGDTIDLSRVVPAGNVLTTAIQGSGSVLGAVQPALGAAITAATGDSSIGSVKGTLPKIEAAVTSITNLFPYTRAADTLRGQKASGQSEYGVFARRANIATEPLTALSAKLKGSAGQEIGRSLGFPFVPYDIQKKRDSTELSRILGDLSKYGSDAQQKLEAHSKGELKPVRKKVIAMQKRYDKAHEELQALYEKHGLGEVAKRSEEIYFYTHPYPGSTDKKSPYEGSGYESSGYEPSGYGGGTEEKPPAFPQKSSGANLSLPGLGSIGGIFGDLTSPLASLVGGEKAQAATRSAQPTLDTVFSTQPKRTLSTRAPSTLAAANALVKQGVSEDKALAAVRFLSPDQRQALVGNGGSIESGVKSRSAQQGRANAKLGAKLEGWGLDANKAAALAESSKKFGVPAELLAAIGKVESGHGTSTLPGVHSGSNSAGAAGPFQIGNGTGEAGDAYHEIAAELWGSKAGQHSEYNYHDAAMVAGRYLQKAGASKDPSTWYDAAFSYNHADWYANEIVGLANAAKSRLWKQAGGQSARRVPKKMMNRYQAAISAADELERATLPYVWGGGHGDPKSRPTGGGLDCSGAVSYVLNKMGALKGSLVSGEMGSVLKPGPGAVTVFYNPTHTFMRIGKKYFGTSQSNPSGGAGYIDPPSASYLAEYNVGHVPGLGKKVAVALGVPTGSSGAHATSTFPGMTLSSNGTVASINPNTATTKKQAGFSDKPIKLSPAEKLEQVERITEGRFPGSGALRRSVGPSAAQLAEIGASLSAERRRLGVG